MKQIVSLVMFFLCTNLLYSQISDDDAKQLYQDAEEMYEAGNFYKCHQMCNDLVLKMGKTNPRILYLDIKAIYNNLSKENDKSEYTLKKNYHNYSRFNNYATDFFSLVDKNNYPEEKYREIVNIQKYFKAGMQEYEHEKDRKPEDAINFLNECSQKFGHRNHNTQYINYNTGDCIFTFSLDGSKLVINALGNLTGETAKYHMVMRERIIVDLSKVWIEVGKFQHYSIYNYFLYNEFGFHTSVLEKYGTPAQDINAPLIVSTKTYVDNKAKFDNILWYWAWHYDKKMQFPDEKFENEIKTYGYRKLDAPLYIYNMFQQFSDEFRDGNYRKRILDAFEFLIDYYGGGTPAENKQDIKSKF